MNVLSFLKKLIEPKAQPAGLVKLIVAASGSEIVRSDLLAILDQEPFHRRAL